MRNKLAVFKELRKALQGGISGNVDLCSDCQKKVDSYREQLLSDLTKEGVKKND